MGVSELERLGTTQYVTINASGLNLYLLHIMPIVTLSEGGNHAT